MIQLTFEPSLDPFHAVFRFLRLRPMIAGLGALSRDHLRILDFYLLFPFRIEAIRLTHQDRKYRKLSAQYESAKPYGEQPEDRSLFNRMEPMQVAALDTLAARRLIDPDRWTVGDVAPTDLLIPEPVRLRAEAANAQDAELMSFLAKLAADYHVTGPRGLKDRTGLMEHRYDAV